VIFRGKRKALDKKGKERTAGRVLLIRLSNGGWGWNGDNEKVGEKHVSSSND